MCLCAMLFWVLVGWVLVGLVCGSEWSGEVCTQSEGTHKNASNHKMSNKRHSCCTYCVTVLMMKIDNYDVC